jgi:tetratricopeptide (TPR) repeat protein
MNQRPTQVFISYSHDSPQHADNVLAVANRLRANGVEAILDQFEEHVPPEGWSPWTAKHLREADFVVVVCTEQYSARLMGQENTGTEPEGTWEGRLVGECRPDPNHLNRRLVPVLCAGAKRKHIPAPLRSLAHYHLNGDAGYLKLYRHLTQLPNNTTATLGGLKALAQKARQQDFFKEPPHNLPWIEPAAFVGRARAFAEVDQKLQSSSGHAAFIFGAGKVGVGITELAVRYARSRLGSYPAGACWVEARFTELAIQILEFAQVHFDMMPPKSLQDTTSRVQYCWSNWPGSGRVLVILHEVNDWDGIQPLLPKEDRFSILVSTTATIAGVPQIRLDKLSAPNALNLLRSLTSSKRMEAEQIEAKLVCKSLRYAPLGLQLAGRYMARMPAVSVSEMHARLESKRLERRTKNQTAGLTTFDIGAVAAFELVWDELSQPARELACMLSFFALAPIPWSLVRVCFPSSEAVELECLRDSELIRSGLLQQRGAGLYQVHQLLRGCLQEKLKSLSSGDQLRRAFVGALTAAARPILPDSILPGLVASTTLIPHFEELVLRMLLEVDDHRVLWPFVALQRTYASQGLWAQAEDWALQGHMAVGMRVGPEHRDLAMSFLNLAELLHGQERYAEAESLYLQALEQWRENSGWEDGVLVSILHNLGRVYCLQGRHEEGGALIQQALLVQRKQAGPEQCYEAKILLHIASICETAEAYSQAEEFYQEALEIQVKHLGADHREVAITLKSLGAFNVGQGHFSKAESLCQRALMIERKELGAKHPRVATTLAYLATVYQHMDQYAKAEELYLQALEIQCKQLHPDHSAMALNYNNLAVLYEGQDKYAQAEPFFKEALKALRRLPESYRPQLALTYHSLARMYRVQNRYEEAEPLLRQALAILQEVMEPDHRGIKIVRDSLESVELHLSRNTSAAAASVA